MEYTSQDNRRLSSIDETKMTEDQNYTAHKIVNSQLIKENQSTTNAAR